MEQRFDDHLKELDEQAIEDGEARELLYCCYCKGYYPPEEMGDIDCLDCETGGSAEVRANMRVFGKVLAGVRAKHERVKGIGQIVRMTPKEGMK